MSRGELMEGVGRKASQLLQILPVPSTWRTGNKFPAEPSGEAKSCLMGCFGLLVVLILAAIIGLFVLLAILGGGADSPESTTESPDVATAVTTATTAADDLALIEGPWRIRNEELSLGGLTAPFVVVERGTFTDAGDGRLVGTSGSGDTAIGFNLVSSSPTERVYTTTFMGAVWTGSGSRISCTWALQEAERPASLGTYMPSERSHGAPMVGGAYCSDARGRGLGSLPEWVGPAGSLDAGATGSCSGAPEHVTLDLRGVDPSSTKIIEFEL